MRRLLFVLAFLILSALPAQAALAHVKHANSAIDVDANTTVVTAAFSGNYSAGNTILCSVGWETDTITVSGVTNGTDTLASAGGPHRHTAGTFSQQYWYKFNVTGGVTTAFTATFSSGPAGASMNCAEISGPPVTPVNAGPSAAEQSNVGTTANTVLSPSISPSINGCYVHSTVIAPYVNTDVINIGTDIAWAGAGSPGTAIHRLEYFVQTSAASIAGAWTNTSAATDNLTTVIALCPAASGTTGQGHKQVINGGLF